MNLLAIDTSGASQGIAALTEEKVLSEIFLLAGRSHSQTLLSSIEAVLEAAHWKLSDIQLYAITVGPGSFTGLRIGLSTLKGICAAHPTPVLGVSTLHALAAGVESSADYLIPCLDAHCGAVFAGVYRSSAQGLQVVQADRAWPVQEWLEYLEKLPGTKCLIGSALQAYAAALQKIPGMNWPEDPKAHQVQPVTLGRVAFAEYQAGKVSKVEDLSPRYLRASEAENRLQNRGQS